MHSLASRGEARASSPPPIRTAFPLPPSACPSSSRPSWWCSTTPIPAGCSPYAQRRRRLLLIVWVFIAVSQLRLRRQLEALHPLPIRMWAFPYLTWFALALFAAIAVLMLTDATARTQLLSAATMFVVLAIAGVINSKVRGINPTSTLPSPSPRPLPALRAHRREAGSLFAPRERQGRAFPRPPAALTGSTNQGSPGPPVSAKGSYPQPSGPRSGKSPRAPGYPQDAATRVATAQHDRIV